ncbi:pectin lyase fold/virulence factor, partial [Blyttiomyces helicus]
MMRPTTLLTTLLTLLTTRTIPAAPARQQCIVTHTPGGDDHSSVMSAFDICKTGGKVVFSAGTEYQVLTPIAATGLSNFDIVIDGNVTFPYNNASLTGITITQARAGHFKISFSSSFRVSNITASSVSNSLNPAKNTDGIDVSSSTSSCHGVSIGSLGPPGKANGSIASVQNVWVEDVSFEGCSTAIHIKSWPSSVQGWASNITYKNVALNNVGYAIN